MTSLSSACVDRTFIDIFITSFTLNSENNAYVYLLDNGVIKMDLQKYGNITDRQTGLLRQYLKIIILEAHVLH